jgi:hypothetical protein
MRLFVMVECFDNDIHSHDSSLYVSNTQNEIEYIVHSTDLLFLSSKMFISKFSTRKYYRIHIKYHIARHEFLL